MKAQCKTCGKNCEGEYCFRHKLRKRISVQNLTKNVKKEESLRNIFEMRDFSYNYGKKEYINQRLVENI